jgi:hypothetical protein
MKKRRSVQPCKDLRSEAKPEYWLPLADLTGFGESSLDGNRMDRSIGQQK